MLGSLPLSATRSYIYTLYISLFFSKTYLCLFWRAAKTACPLLTIWLWLEEEDSYYKFFAVYYTFVSSKTGGARCDDALEILNNVRQCLSPRPLATRLLCSGVAIFLNHDNRPCQSDDVVFTETRAFCFAGVLFISDWVQVQTTWHCPTKRAMYAQTNKKRQRGYDHWILGGLSLSFHDNDSFQVTVLP